MLKIAFGISLIIDELPEGTAKHLHLLVNQFEEVYSLCEGQTVRDVFIQVVLYAASMDKGRISVILTLRSDFLGSTQQHTQLSGLTTKQHALVPALRQNELREAIAEPAVRAGHPIDDATANLLIARIEEREGALPLLQFVLSRIWNGITEGIEPAPPSKNLAAWAAPWPLRHSLSMTSLTTMRKLSLVAPFGRWCG